jgi:hypothetical protein
MTVDFALVPPVAEGYLKLSYMDWQCLAPGKSANYYVCALPCPVSPVYRS